MDFFEMSRNPSNDNLNWIFFFQVTSFAQNICFLKKNCEKHKTQRFLLKNECLPPPKMRMHFFVRQMKMDFEPMCLMCANTLFFFSGQRERSNVFQFQTVFEYEFSSRKKVDFITKCMRNLMLKMGGEVDIKLKSDRYLGFVLKRDTHQRFKGNC